MVKYIEPKELAEKIRNGNERILIIDVRDHDYLVGKIKGSIHVPYCDLDKYFPELNRISSDFKSIVFHCHYSAQRGPSSAEYFEESFPHNTVNVLVLKGGFSKWKTLFRNHPDLFEKLDQ